MTTSRLGATGTVVLHVAAPTPSVVLVSVYDDAGRLVLRRRVRDLRVALTLPTGRLLVTVADERSLRDPRRLTGGSVALEVTEHDILEGTLTLSRGAVVCATTARHARISAVHRDGQRVEARADSGGRVVLGGLLAGEWTLVAHDARRSRCSTPVTVVVSAGATNAVRLDADVATGRLLVRLRGGDRREVLADHVVLTDTTGRRVSAPVRGGIAELRELAPGAHILTVPASVGHLGTEVDVVVAAGSLGVVEAVVPVGATISGRVVQHIGLDDAQYAAVVVLLDEAGDEVERVRTDEDGCFVLGRGLGSRDGLTVVATAGPQTLHVTRAAVAEVSVITGVHHHLGDIALPVGGRPAVWTARTPAVAGMKLPSTRV